MLEHELELGHLADDLCRQLVVRDEVGDKVMVPVEVSEIPDAHPDACECAI